MAGFFGIGDYTRAGKGIAKGERKGRLKLFFEILGVRIWKLFVLNLIYLIFCLPVITIGPATAGMMKVVKNYSIDKNAFVWMDFIAAFKENFKKSFFVGIADVIAYTGVICGMSLYPQMWGNPEYTGPAALPYILFILTLSAAMSFTIMNYYIYLMIVSTNLPMKAIIKNSVSLAFIEPKMNLLAFASNIVLPLILIGLFFALKNVLLIVIFPFAPASLIAFIVAFCCYPVVQKYVIDPYYKERGEKNPEKYYDESADGEETLFEDMGGKEKAFIPKEKKGKGKVIS